MLLQLVIALQLVCKPFSPSEVTLLPSRFSDNAKRDTAWLMSIPVESLVHSFQTTSGVWAGKEGGYMTVRKLGGWESMDCELRGHTTGHILSALAWFEGSTGSQEAHAKADSILTALYEVQQAHGNGYLSAFPEELINRNIRGKSVWAPFYTLHKILQGLIDQYNYCGSEKALEMARGMGDWAYNKLCNLDEETRTRMIRNEFGGFNDAMYQLYAITGDEHHLWVARYFYHNDKVDPLKNGNSNLGTNHANTFIPKLLGEARNYEMFGATDSRSAAELLFWTLVNDHAFVTGEVSDKEHLFKPSAQSKHLSGYDGENCCTFNLLKLADHVFCWNPSSEVADYYERALYNHILGQQDTLSGMVCYFTPLMTGAYRLLSTRDQSFWCCVGSGFEQHLKYNSSIYFHSDNALWINLLIPSQLNWDGTTITQQSSISTAILTIGGKAREFAMKLRRPYWATSMEVKVNGRKISAKTDESGYCSIQRKWKTGDKVEVTYGIDIHEEATADAPNRYALLYGPIVMAGRLEDLNESAQIFSDPKAYNDYYSFDYKIPEEFKQVKYSSDIPLIPFYNAQRCRYVVYWQK